MAYSSSHREMSCAFERMAFQDGYSEDSEGSGLMYATSDLRTKQQRFRQSRPPMSPGQMWTDEEFFQSEAVTDCATRKIVWRRPNEFLRNPQLFVGGAERYDVQQKHFGTCWFLSMLANLADKPRLLKKVINAESYKPRTDGICCCKLWKFGEWEDIYIDDYLPLYRVKGGLQFYGAMSWTDSDELWVSFLEKALAKMYGSYCVVDEGGLPSEAYLALTGGVSETVLITDYISNPRSLFRRLDKALKTRAMVTSCILEEYSGDRGLIGAHAYSLNQTATVTRFNGKVVRLIRIRNPHGTNEWKGKWSDRSPEWQTLPEGGNLRRDRDDGEFWMSLEDFMSNFTQTTICSLTPDFDKDGQSDPLNYVLRIFGEWGQKMEITIPGACRKPMFSEKYRDLAPTGSIPIVVQIVQKEVRRSFYCDIGCSLSDANGRRIPDIERKPTHAAELQRVFRYTLPPGDMQGLKE
ncbi:calpain-A-like isoform X2 [Haliotis rufescens]|uniref:calpain-A-like isoform X2 n=1 Tax=Haliotis rufescens TaxID=6454 RepID=UPI00201F19A9|nr:calpain-A-like isoform X2 [Haliotis rufescens]